ncbi:MAG: excinuclease ABC subunit A [Parcubacteria group bacterium GW2011_GWA2_38_13b]|nr:MAG: excinuclease ABC subunit A [Parcubacteria group bacterium GW2011_GWA2_38_13b]
MESNYIKIRGARVHNLKNINVDIPRNKLVVITGLSGSGKSSLAFDTIYAEGQRKYVESLSAYARQFLGVMDKPDVDKIEGLSPAISIDQRSVSHNPRSTVGTSTEIYDYLRLLFAKVGIPYCPICGKNVTKQSAKQIVQAVLKIPRPSKVIILSPVIKNRKGEFAGLLEKIGKMGYLRVRIDGIIYSIGEVSEITIDKNEKHNIEIVIDSLIIDEEIEKARIIDSVETALKIGEGFLIVSISNKLKKIEKDFNFNQFFVCPMCNFHFSEISSRLFSFNSPYGACPECTGLGNKQEIDPDLMIPNKNLTLAEGAIKPLAFMSHGIGKQNWYWRFISEFAVKYGISLNAPIKKIDQKKLNLLFYGEKENGADGVISQLEKKYREADSDFTRSEIEKYMIVKECPLCRGKRLCREALAVKFNNTEIDKISEMTVSEAVAFFEDITERLSEFSKSEQSIISPIAKEILSRLGFLLNIGLDYVTLSRSMSTLSGGESQRIRLATQIGSGLSGVVYVLDEPSIGLHQKDQGKLINTIKKLRDAGNTVIVVEHDEQTIREADWVIDIGPGAGQKGGRVVFAGTPKELLRDNNLTGEYLSGKKTVGINDSRKFFSFAGKNIKTNGDYLEIIGAAEHNLKNIDVKIPIGKLVCISGVSGSGKSTLINDILANALLKKFYQAKTNVGAHKALRGVENIDKIVVVDQSPIGRTPRSNPATYTGMFTFIRNLFVQTREAKLSGYKAGKFSFNVRGGRCEECEGQGMKKIEMYFLPDVYVECEECSGTRFSKSVLEIEYRGKNIAEILSMSIDEAGEFFNNIFAVKNKLKIISEVGLGYVKLGQPAPTLSGGEAQRIKLATELSRRETGKTLYVLDEPTTGLHFDDIKKLLGVLKKLVEKKNTVLIIEHNLDVLVNADWIIDLGPEGGDKGGRIIAEGTVRDVAGIKESFTGQYLKEKLKKI